MKLTLDIPPSANTYWRHNRGRTHRSHEANDYRDYVTLLCRTAGIEPLTGDISVRLVFYRPARRYDLDNIFKQLFDALQGNAYENDKQIAHIHARRDDTQSSRPRIELEITSL